MEVSKEYITIEKKGRVFVHGPSNASEVWIVFHGYGQLAAYFIQKFQCIANENTKIIAPEGLSRFYLDEQYTRVGANWMTKDDRLIDIEEQFVFLQAVYNQYVPVKPQKLILFGFSQGTSTLWRWMKKAKIQADHVVLWAGSMPSEAEYLSEIQAKLWYATGDQDPYLKFINIEEIENQAKKISNQFEKISFEGGHTILEVPLKNLANKIRKI